MADAILVSEGGERWDSDWYGQKTAAATSTNYAVGRVFRLRQTLDLDSDAGTGTNDGYLNLNTTTTGTNLEMFLSGAWRGSAAPDSTYVSTGYLYTNIIPEPSTVALLGLGALVLFRRRRRA